MKKYILFLIILTTYTSCIVYKSITRNEIVGWVYDQDKKPIVNATILFVLEENILDMKLYKSGDSTQTDKNGYYYFDEVSSMKTGKLGGDRITPFMLPYRFVVKKNNIIISDTINSRDFKNQSNKIVVDTLFLK